MFSLYRDTLFHHMSHAVSESLPCTLNLCSYRPLWNKGQAPFTPGVQELTSLDLKDPAKPLCALLEILKTRAAAILPCFSNRVACLKAVGLAGGHTCCGQAPKWSFSYCKDAAQECHVLSVF